MAARGYRIGKIAEESGVTVKAIRYYEKIGLIPQALRDNSGSHTGGNRVYSAADLGRLRFIRHARLLGLSLAEIRRLLVVAGRSGCPSTQPEYQEMLRRHIDEIDERVDHLLGLRASLEGLLSLERNPVQPCSLNTCACMAPVRSTASSAGKPSANVNKR